jgi:hypothetical protein
LNKRNKHLNEQKKEANEIKNEAPERSKEKKHSNEQKNIGLASPSSWDQFNLILHSSTKSSPPTM